jgi:hypothetical protein
MLKHDQQGGLFPFPCFSYFIHWIELKAALVKIISGVGTSQLMVLLNLLQQEKYPAGRHVEEQSYFRKILRRPGFKQA